MLTEFDHTPRASVLCPGFLQLNAAPEQRCLFLPLHAVFGCVQTMVWPQVSGILNAIFNVSTDVGARDCTWGPWEPRGSPVGAPWEPRGSPVGECTLEDDNGTKTRLCVVDRISG